MTLNISENQLFIQHSSVRFIKKNSRGVFRNLFMGGGLKFFFPCRDQGDRPENPLKTIDFTGLGWTEPQ